MKKLIAQYKPVIKFILIFLAVYVVLSFCYKLYLDVSFGSTYYPDFFTHVAAKSSQKMLNVFGYDTYIYQHRSKPFLKLVVNGNYLARVIEGCNSISVIVLFVAFIVAFASGFKVTFWYALLGSCLIFIINSVRITILALGIYYFPKFTDVLHSVIFPGIIYGMVFLLWVFWVNRFSGLKQKKHG